MLAVPPAHVCAPVPTACVTIPHNVVIVDATSIQHVSEYVEVPLSTLIVLSLTCVPTVSEFVVTVRLRIT